MKRKDNQSFADYQKERAIHNERLREYLKGRPIFTGGTYNAGKNAEKRLKRQGDLTKTN
jgi:hypothetical protein